MKPKPIRFLPALALLMSSGLTHADTITFETGEGYTTGSIAPTNGGTTNAPFNGQQGWSRSTSNGTGGIITTTDSGEYVGGQALSAAASAGSATYIGGKLDIVQTAASNTISFDLRFAGLQSVTAGFLGDNDNNLFDQSLDTGMQFGVNAGSVYVRDALFGGNTSLPGLTGALIAGNWYRYNITIGEVVSSERSITMSVRNLTTATTLDLNGASEGTDYVFTVADSAFGVAPEDAVGGFVRVSGQTSGAMSAIDNLSLTALAGSDPFATWALGAGLDGSPGKEAGFDDDPDGDGVANGLEWILGGNPLDGKSGSLVATTAATANGLTLSFTRNEDSIGQATLTVEYNTDLGAAWQSAAIGATSSGPDTNDVTVTIDTATSPDQVTVNIPASNAPNGRLFARLNAQTAP